MHVPVQLVRVKYRQKNFVVNNSLMISGDTMAINAQQLRKLITDVLISTNLYSKDATELLMLTAAQESHAGTYIEQIKGPALGIFQMEPRTHNDIYESYLKYKPQLRQIADMLRISYDFTDEIGDLNLRANLPYQIVMARIYYMRFSEPLPKYNDLPSLAYYWKKYWNTSLGKGTVYQAQNNYERYAT